MNKGYIAAWVFDNIPLPTSKGENQMTLRDKIADVCDEEIQSDNPSCYVLADAILSVIAESVEPLQWEGVEGDCFVTCDTESHTYDLLVFDTLERPHDYVWSARAVPHTNPHVSDRISSGSFEDVVKASNEHRRTFVLSSIGLSASEQAVAVLADHYPTLEQS